MLCQIAAFLLEDGTQFDILQGNLFGYKGAIFEGLPADSFSKMGRTNFTASTGIHTTLSI